MTKARIIPIILSVLLLYVLSFGPVSRLVGTVAPQWYFTAYAPIIWAAQHSDAVNDCLVWYLDLCHGRFLERSL